jgi:HSP20 family protein
VFVVRDYDDSLDVFQLLNRYLRQVEASLDLDQRGLGISGGGFRERDGQLVLDVEVPGVGKDDIDISAQGQVLSIRAKHTEDAPEGYRLLRRERPGQWQMNRTFTVPTVADPDSIQCKLQDGVLNVRMNKREQSNPRRIAVDAQEA